MLGAFLGNLQGEIALVHNFLLDAVYFVAKDKGVACTGITPELIQFYGIHSLLDGYHGVAVFFSLPDQLHNVLNVLERH